MDAITVDTSLSGQCGSGVLVAPDGTVQALVSIDGLPNLAVLVGYLLKRSLTELS